MRTLLLRGVVVAALSLAPPLAPSPCVAAGLGPEDMSTMMRSMMSMMRLWNSFADADEWSLSSEWDPSGTSSGRDPWSRRGGGTSMPWSQVPWSQMPSERMPWGQMPGGAGPPSFPMNPWQMPGKRMPGGWSGPSAREFTGLDGRWRGNTGDLIEIRGNRIRIGRPGQPGIEGTLVVQGAQLIVYMREGGVGAFEFERRGPLLALRDPTGRVNLFRQEAGLRPRPYGPPGRR